MNWSDQLLQPAARRVHLVSWEAVAAGALPAVTRSRSAGQLVWSVCQRC